jgi:acyl-CoA thioester hydrolase
VPNLMAGWRREASAANNSEAAGAVVEARLVYRRFPQAGDLIEVFTGVGAVGDKTFRLVHWLCDPESGQAWASMEALALTFDTKTRKAIEATPEARAKMQARVIAMSV